MASAPPPYAATGPWVAPPATGFCHEALHYRGGEDLVNCLVPFVRQGVILGEPVLVILPRASLRRLRKALGADAHHVEFGDMDVVGANPCRIIPVWTSFIERHEGGPVRGVGEPIGPSRRGEALVESQHHEDLLNVAFDAAVPVWLLCPYDVTALDPDVVRHSMCNHAFICDGSTHRASDAFLGRKTLGRPVSDPLPLVPSSAGTLEVDGPCALGTARRQLEAAAVACGLADRAADVVLAVDELVANSLRHGGGRAEMAVWVDAGMLRCQVTDGGEVDDPLAGRRRPPANATGGRGLWIANHLSDLLQVRSMPGRTVVRVSWRQRT